MHIPNDTRRYPAATWAILVLGAAGFAGLAYGSLAQAPITVLGEIHRVSRIDQFLSFPSFTAVGHFFAYALAAFAVMLVTPIVGHWPRGRRWRLLPYAGLAMLAIGLEVAQLGTATRSFDWVDLVAGVAGVGIVAPARLLLWVRSLPG